MSDRTAIASFGKNRKFRHCKANLLGGALLLWSWFFELVSNIPALLRLRKHYRKSTSQATKVVIFSDNLDETNGIAINARQVVEYLRNQDCDLVLMGIAFHTRQGGLIEKCGTHLLPQAYSMEQVGYNESELAIPCLPSFIAWLAENRVKLIEIETPSSGGMMIAACAKIIGIRVISHYRTDIFAYSDLLVSSRMLVYFIKTWVSLFNRWTAPVIVPSTYFIDKLQDESKLSSVQVRYLERGIPLESFGPDKAQNLWESYFEKTKQPKTRFLFVGRVSKEKELDLLIDLWKELRMQKNVELLIVGQGPYLHEMKAICAPWPEIVFSGKLHGTELAACYAEADFFVFPSGTDTFGNVVVEALASGTPALVSDMGGPRDIVDLQSGWVIPFRNRELWLKQLLQCCEITLDKSKYQSLSTQAVNRSKHFKLENAARILWDFYQEIDNVKH